LALKTSDIDHFDVNLWRSFILKNLFFVILLNRGYFWNIRQNIRYLLGKCLGVGYLSELGVVSFFTVSQRGNECKKVVLFCRCSSSILVLYSLSYFYYKFSTSSNTSIVFYNKTFNPMSTCIACAFFQCQTTSPRSLCRINTPS